MVREMMDEERFMERNEQSVEENAWIWRISRENT